MKALYRYSAVMILSTMVSLLLSLLAYANGTHEGRLKPVETRGDIIATMDTKPVPLSLGDNKIYLSVLDSNKKYLENASISVTATMVGMKMKTDNDRVTLIPEGKMLFRGTVNISMGGLWHINVFIDHGNGKHDMVVFEEKVKWEL